eukprot:g8558.t1
MSPTTPRNGSLVGKRLPAPAKKLPMASGAGASSPPSPSRAGHSECNSQPGGIGCVLVVAANAWRVRDDGRRNNAAPGRALPSIELLYAQQQLLEKTQLDEDEDSIVGKFLGADKFLPSQFPADSARPIMCQCFRRPYSWSTRLQYDRQYHGQRKLKVKHSHPRCISITKKCRCPG